MCIKSHFVFRPVLSFSSVHVARQQWRLTRVCVVHVVKMSTNVTSVEPLTTTRRIHSSATLAGLASTPSLMCTLNTSLAQLWTPLRRRMTDRRYMLLVAFENNLFV